MTVVNTKQRYDRSWFITDLRMAAYRGSDRTCGTHGFIYIVTPLSRITGNESRISWKTSRSTTLTHSRIHFITLILSKLDLFIFIEGRQPWLRGGGKFTASVFNWVLKFCDITPIIFNDSMLSYICEIGNMIRRKLYSFSPNWKQT